MSRLSDYELERLANIEANERKLKELGIVAPSSTVLRDVKPKPHRTLPTVRTASVPTRASKRTKRTDVQYRELTDEYFRKEERAAVKGVKVHQAKRTRERLVVKKGSGETKRPSLPSPPAMEARTHNRPQSACLPVASEKKPVPMTKKGAEDVVNVLAHTSRSFRCACPLCGKEVSLRADGCTLQKHAGCGSVRLGAA